MIAVTYADVAAAAAFLAVETAVCLALIAVWTFRVRRSR